MPIPLPWLGHEALADFPNPQHALDEPNGLLAAGGDLQPARLLNAYRQGIFPWYSEGEPILWWCPSPRTVFSTDTDVLSRRMRRSIKQSGWHYRFDHDFAQVMRHCAHIPRPHQQGTWIHAEMLEAYQNLHAMGRAHSVEIMDGERMVGGLYGVAIGQMFFAESMFSLESGGSKLALAALLQQLKQWGWPLVDAQVENPHLLSLGAQLLPRARFLSQIHNLVEAPAALGRWASSAPTGKVSAL